jgi:hypothetical protein
MRYGIPLCGAGVLFLVVGVLVAGLFMWLGARIAGVKQANFGRAVVAAVASWVVTGLCYGLAPVLPLVGVGLATVGAVLLSVVVIRAAFDTTLGKALLVWIFSLIVQVVAVLLTGLPLFGVVGRHVGGTWMHL